MGNLTKRAVDALQYTKANGRRQVLWDAALPGFGVRIYPSGKKAFILSYLNEGRKRLMTLGDYGVLTLEEAKGKRTTT